MIAITWKPVTVRRLVSWAADMCRHAWPRDCRVEPEPYVAPSPGIGSWDPWLKPGPCSTARAGEPDVNMSLRNFGVWQSVDYCGRRRTEGLQHAANVRL